MPADKILLRWRFHLARMLALHQPRSAFRNVINAITSTICAFVQNSKMRDVCREV
jgi:hypothetical protein